MNICTIRGCGTTVRARYSPYCPAHRKALARHGHPEARAILPRDVRPFLALIEKRQRHNFDSPAWTILRSRVEALMASSRSILAAYEAGKASLRFQVEASRMLREVEGNASADLIVRAAVAVAMHRTSAPHRYLGELSLPYAMARHVIRLAPLPRGSYFDSKRSKTVGFYRDVPPKALEWLGWQLVEAFAGAGVQLADLEMRGKSVKAAEEKALGEAIASLV
jgi:hypothetical protein